MPLSDAARRLLSAKAGHDDAPADPPKPSDDPNADENVDAAELERRKGFRERARREDERFRLATDSEYWVAFCFRRPDDPAKFRSALDLQVEGRLIPGPMLAAATSSHAQAAHSAKARAKALLKSRGLGGAAGETTADRMNDEGLPDPLAGLEPTGDLQADAAAELDALMAAFKAATARTGFGRIHDSPHWLVAYWFSREEKETWLGMTALDVLGDKYLDGHKAAGQLHITL